MIIYLYGADTYRSHQALQKMKEKFVKERDPQELNLQTIAVDDLAPEAVIEQLFTAPFLAEKRMVVLPGLLEFGSKELHALFLDVIKEERLPTDTIVLVLDGEVKPRAKASKALQKILQEQPYSISHTEMKSFEKKQWIINILQTLGSQADTAALQVLSEQVVPLYQLVHILDQLVAYTDGKSITVDDVALFLSPSIDDNIFHLVDVAISGDKSQVFKLIEEQYRNGKDAMYIFSMLLRQYRIMLDIADALDRGISLSGGGAAKGMGLHPFVLKKTIPLVQRLSFETISKKYADLLEIDIKIKTGKGSAEELVSVFVGKI